MTIAYLNGQYLPIEEAHISPLDRGFLFSDGVYEVVTAYQGHLFFIDKHLKRLSKSLAAIRLENPYKTQALHAIMQQLVQSNGEGNQYLYLQITRGPTGLRKHDIEANITPTLFAYSAPLEIPNYTQGVKVITLADTRWAGKAIKSIGVLPNMLSHQRALDAGAKEALLFDKDGHVLEGSRSNLFIIQKGTLITHPADHAILSGIRRQLTLHLAQKIGLPIEERPITKDELYAADEVWLSSSTWAICPVVQVDDHIISEQLGKHWQAIWQAWQHYKQAFIQGHEAHA